MYPFLQNSCHFKYFFSEAKRRQEILLLILIVSTGVVNVLKNWALPLFGWFNDHTMCTFLYSSDSGTAPCDPRGSATEEELKNEKEVCAATSTGVEGIYHMPLSNSCISTNFGIGKCGGRRERLMCINKEQAINEKKGLTILILDFVLLYCVTVVFHFFGFIPLIPKLDQFLTY